MKKAEKGKKKKEKEEAKVYTIKDLENILDISENDFKCIDEKIGLTNLVYGKSRYQNKNFAPK